MQLFSVVISLDSALKKDEVYYPQVFLEECKYIEKEKKWFDIIFYDLGKCSDSDYSDVLVVVSLLFHLNETNRLFAPLNHIIIIIYS